MFLEKQVLVPWVFYVNYEINFFIRKPLQGSTMFKKKKARKWPLQILSFVRFLVTFVLQPFIFNVN